MTKKGMNNTEQLLTMAVVGLIGLLAINFGGDYVFRGAQMEVNEIMGEAWTTQAEWNVNQNKANILIATVLEQLDKDVRSNMKVIDQLTGLLLRGGF